MRGSHEGVYYGRLLHRSIPACAGQPYAYNLDSKAHEVYPRVCGAAQDLRDATEYVCGLSPRVRGSRVLAQHLPGRHRSIPACAGQPPGRASGAPTLRVYPRVCGAAAQGVAIRVRGGGLSPRVRGSLNLVLTNAPSQGSIPACAGQPVVLGVCVLAGPVYPRVCGAASTRLTSIVATGGLSPRVRGSPQARQG